MSQRVHIVIEDGRVEILVNDGEQVVVQSSPPPSQESDKPSGPVSADPPVISPEAKAAAAKGLEIAEFVANAPVDDTQRTPDLDLVRTEHPLAPTYSPRINGGGNIASRPMPASTVLVRPTIPRRCEVCNDDISHLHFKSKICKKPECKKAKVKAQNEKSRLKAGRFVGVGTGRAARSKQSMGKQFEQNTAVPRLADEAPPAKSYTRSRCCEAKVEYDTDTLGHRCLACMNECEVYEYIPPFVNVWDCGACLEAGRLCRLHASMEAEGKKPLMRPNQ